MKGQTTETSTLQVDGEIPLAVMAGKVPGLNSIFQQRSRHQEWDSRKCTRKDPGLWNWPSWYRAGFDATESASRLASAGSICRCVLTRTYPPSTHAWGQRWPQRGSCGEMKRVQKGGLASPRGVSRWLDLDMILEGAVYIPYLSSFDCILYYKNIIYLELYVGLGFSGP